MAYTIDTNLLCKTLVGIDAKLFDHKSSYVKTDIQINLDGRTHYADDDTLKFHHSRLLGRSVLASGAFFYIVESVALNYENSKRGCRVVLFDVFGNTVYRPKLEDCATNSDKARKAFWAWYETLDVASYYEGKLQERATNMVRSLAKYEEALSVLSTKEAA